MKDSITIASRKSPLAMAQTTLFSNYLKEKFPGIEVNILPVVTTGDKQTSWSLQKEGGKGLFTKELEIALLLKEADIAVHSGKDLPTENPDGLSIAGYLEREDPRDVLVIKEGIEKPKFIGTGSPRRRAQASKMFPTTAWTEIRGNVDTRIKKVVNGLCDATFLAQAGLNRLGIDQWEGVEFRPIPITEMVPAVGQAAIAIQCRNEDVEWLQPITHQATLQAVTIERMFLHKLGGGCQSAFAGHYYDGVLHVFHENSGYASLALPDPSAPDLEAKIHSFISDLKDTQS